MSASKVTFDGKDTSDDEADHESQRQTTPPAPPSEGRLSQVDTLRVLGCLSVIALHAVCAPFSADSVGLGATTLMLHYSREVFLFVSALVLTRVYYPRLGPDARLPSEQHFRLRRLTLIGIPYLCWSTVYIAMSLFHTRDQTPWSQTLHDLPIRWINDIVTGGAWYHLYFLLVTLQYGIMFPLVLRLLSRTRGHHHWVLGVSLMTQTATLYFYQHWQLPGIGWRAIIGDASLPAYQLWLIAGAIAGLHLPRWHHWVMQHRTALATALPIASTALLWTYFTQVPTRGAMDASSPLQPIMIVWATAVLAVLYMVAVFLTTHGPPQLNSLLSYLAQLSFGIYLAHPLVLDLVTAALRRLQLFPPNTWAALTTLILTTTLTTVLCTALHRTPFSSPLVGRAQRHSPTPTQLTPPA